MDGQGVVAPATHGTGPPPYTFVTDVEVANLSPGKFSKSVNTVGVCVGDDAAVEPALLNQQKLLKLAWLGSGMVP